MENVEWIWLIMAIIILGIGPLICWVPWRSILFWLHSDQIEIDESDLFIAVQLLIEYFHEIGDLDGEMASRTVGQHLFSPPPDLPKRKRVNSKKSG